MSEQVAPPGQAPGSLIAVMGSGYVGLTTAACLASLGNDVVCADIDAERVARLNRGEIPIHERGLAELVAAGLQAGRLRFVVGAATAMAGVPDLIFLCVPTPLGDDGRADVSAVDAVLDEIAGLVVPGAVVVTKSTVPVGTARRIAATLAGRGIGVASNPEFLREGTAVEDFLRPDRVVVGADEPAVAERVAALYEGMGAPIERTGTASAELIKYAANTYLAMKLSYVHFLTALCEQFGADVADVARGIGHDPRIGKDYLKAGPGWGGPCLPKDVRALQEIAAEVGVASDLLGATLAANERQVDLVADKVRVATGGTLAGRRIGVLGLTFKAGTDDLRGSPALAVAHRLRAEGAVLSGYDPQVPVALPGITDDLTVVDDVADVAKDADVIVVLTEWPEFRTLDWRRLAGLVGRAVIVDTRNLLDDDVLHRAGFTLVGLGRDTRGAV